MKIGLSNISFQTFSYSSLSNNLVAAERYCNNKEDKTGKQTKNIYQEIDININELGWLREIRGVI